MDDQNTEVEQTEATSSKLDIRGSLADKYNKSDDSPRYSKSDTAAEPTAAKIEKELDAIEADSIPRAVAPPSDMSKAEREAFLKPTEQNAHVLQAYLSRRSYETRSEYERKKVELERAQKQTEAMSGIWETAKSTYSGMKLDPALVLENAIKWDVAMRDNPTTAALEYLENYGVTPEDLYQHWQQQQQSPQSYQQNSQAFPQADYLTRADAERIAEQRIQAVMAEQQQMVVAQQNLTTVQSFMLSKPLFTAADSQTAQQLEEKMAPVVAALTQQGGSSQADVLETAYNYVVNGDPVFSDLAKKLSAAQKVTTQTKETARAKHASRSISGSVGSGSPRMAIKDIRENLRRRLNGID